MITKNDIKKLKKIAPQNLTRDQKYILNLAIISSLVGQLKKKGY